MKFFQIRIIYININGQSNGQYLDTGTWFRGQVGPRRRTIMIF